MASLAIITAVTVLYFASLAVYRLYLSPVAKIPGPKIAALTSWYCAYHDIFKGSGGQYIWAIKAMHRQYGPVVRIAPDLVHVNDPSFIDKLYPSNPNLRRERASTFLSFFKEQLSVLPTRDHTLHRHRRAVLSKFFSQQNVRRLMPTINDTLVHLLRRMEDWAKSDEPVAINPAFKAATKDIIQSYSFGEGRKCLDSEDCDATFFACFSPKRFVHVFSHFHWFHVLLTMLPPSLLIAINPMVVAYIDYMKDLEEKLARVSEDKDSPEGKTIFHEILRSDIPESEKSKMRLLEEARILVLAGSDTTAATMASLTYHVLSDRKVFERLREELNAVMPDANQPPDPVMLDKLPFLNALIEEILRLYPSSSHRQDRVAPDEDLVYQYADGSTLTIPAGTMIGMAAPLVNHHPATCTDPESFEPDRYIENPKLMRKHLTFSKGVRQCLGINLAYQELQVFTAGIFRKYSMYNDSLEQQDGPTLELYETKIEDIQLHSDFIQAEKYPESAGVRLRIRHN